MVTLHSCHLPPQAVEAASVVASLLPDAPLSKDVEDKPMDGDRVTDESVPPGRLDEPLSTCTAISLRGDSLDMPTDESDEAMLAWAKRLKRRHAPY